MGNYDDDDDSSDHEQKIHTELTESKQQLREKDRLLTDLKHHREQEQKRAEKLDMEIKREREARLRENQKTEEKMKTLHSEKDNLREQHEKIVKELEKAQSHISSLSKPTPYDDSPKMKALKKEVDAYQKRF